MRRPQIITGSIVTMPVMMNVPSKAPRRGCVIAQACERVTLLPIIICDTVVASMPMMMVVPATIDSVCTP